ncbi:MAG: CDC48 family AAA ATPase [Candidatus Diapherotrites archaeon]|uniref:CDC48 family AAA ATPase n=1 Tax=Candidatus Iainarchaeum sp. TaxID=3101447 RepID=A0A7K4C062_9ARCH|nr:CDC48 family AAA ATPase [Candidatus Diapherotrites archaeon]
MVSNNPSKGADVFLFVQDPDPTHVGRNIVTLDKETKDLLNITSGDIVVIEGEKKTAAIVWPARTDDEGKKIIRADSFIRHNAGVALGDKVKVSKGVPQEAKRITLAPIEEVRIIASGYERILKKSFLGRPLTIGDNVWVSVFGSGFIYRVVETQPRTIVKVTDATQFVLKEKPVKDSLESVPKVAYEDIGGLDEQVKKVREMVELPMKHPELFQKLGIVPPKGVLLHGPPGTGKTLLAKAVANEAQVHFISISAPEIMGKFVGEAEERIRNLFKEAKENGHSIIFIDEIDAIAPKRDEVVGEVERRVVAQLLSLLDGLEARGEVIVMAATNRVNSIDEALRRPGRFDREIEIGIPDKRSRKQILSIHTRGMPLSEDVDLAYFADLTHGFVGADLNALAKEAAMKSLRRYLPEINLQDETLSPEVLEKLEIKKEDFVEALKDVQPSALREVAIEIPNVKWSDIGSLDLVKQELKQTIEWPLKKPHAFKEMGINPPKGVLLYGPPGTGKTMLAKAIATETESNFISIKGPELLSMWVGESEKGVRKIFRKARQVAPCIIFFDEFDALAPKRGGQVGSNYSEKIVNQLLTEIDGVEALKDVVIIAATNRPDLIDPALLRSGRIDKLIMVPAPDEKSREQILKVITKKVKISNDVDIKELAKKTKGFSGADLDGLIREAALLVLSENKLKPAPITKKHIDQILEKLVPTIDEETEKAYDKFKETALDYRPTYVR